MEHTKEPWQVREKGVREAGCDHHTFVGVAGGGLIAYVVIGNGTGTGQQLWDRAGENARRIVACVNACEGITTEELEHVASCSSRLQTRLDYLMLAAEAALVRLPD